MNLDKCPKCGGKTGTYRHPNARVWCLECGFELRPEGMKAPIKKRTYTQTIDFPPKYVIGLKRFYFPADITITCPKCNKKIDMSYEDEYISYPEVGETQTSEAYCEQCDHYVLFSIKIKKLTMDIEIES